MALVLATCVGCGTGTAPPPSPSGNLEPLTVGWQQFFAIVWEAARRDQGVLIEGYITNTWGFVARDVRLLVNSYDGSGQRIGQVIAWGPNEIPPGDRVYFDVTVAPGAATYDVNAFSWRWKWPPSGGAERWLARRALD